MAADESSAKPEGKMRRLIRGVREWVRMRFHLPPIDQHIVHHRVSRTPWYFSDGAALVALIGILVVTGLTMSLIYVPAPERAYQSVQDITDSVLFGEFIRALHYWSAGMTVFVLVLHLLRHTLFGGYLPPREGTWLIGVALFFVVISTSFIGYTLRWDERSVYAVRVTLHILSKVPLIGEQLVLFVQGGEFLGAGTLSRLYSVHVLFAPVTLGVLIAYHLYLVLALGVTTRWERQFAPGTAEEQMRLRAREKEHPRFGEEYFPSTAARSLPLVLAVTVLVVMLSLTRGAPELGPFGSLTRDLAHPQEEWWFHWYSALTALLPPPVAQIFHWVFPLALLLVLLSLPFVDRGSNRGVRRRPLAVITVACIVLGLTGLTGLRMKSSWEAWPNQDLLPLPATYKATPSVEEGRRLFTVYGCNTCHSIGGHGSKFGLNLSDLDRRLSSEELRRYILHPPQDVAMPAFAGRLSPQELDALVDLVLAAQTFPREYP